MSSPSPFTITPTTAPEIPPLLTLGLTAFTQYTTLIFRTFPLSPTSLAQLSAARMKAYDDHNSTAEKPISFTAKDRTTGAIIGSARWSVVARPEAITETVEEAVNKAAEGEGAIVEETRREAWLGFEVMMGRRERACFAMAMTDADAVAESPQANIMMEAESAGASEAGDSEPLLWLRPRIVLDSISTAQAYQGKGVGKMLMRWGIEESERTGLNIYLTATEAGRPFYERCGFEEVDCFEIDGRQWGVDIVLRYTIMVRKARTEKKEN